MQTTLVRHLCCFLALSLVFQLPLAERAAAEDKQVMVPVGTPVEIRINETVSSQTHKVGQAVHAIIAQDVVIQGQVVIKAGSPVRARISRVQKKSALGSPGEVGIVIESVSATDNSTILLSASAQNEGDSQVTLAVVLGVLICLPLLLITGKRGEIENGTIVSGCTASMATVSPPS